MFGNQQQSQPFGGTFSFGATARPTGVFGAASPNPLSFLNPPEQNSLPVRLTEARNQAWSDLTRLSVLLQEARRSQAEYDQTLRDMVHVCQGVAAILAQAGLRPQVDAQGNLSFVSAAAQPTSTPQ